MDVDDSDPAAERVGRLLDEKWTLERVLGSGGMGAVYAARHRNGARAAVKVLHPELARRPDVRERFLREGYAANRVEHRGAVRVLDDDIVKEGVDAGTVYLVMEMLDGESLEERVERGPPLTETELLHVLDDVLAVLEAAHEHGVIHRDLKPANLFLNKDPAGPGVKVLDFGLARLAEARSLTGAGLALGTPSFMAPEQANGKTAEIDARSDLFAVGATAFMLLSGRGVHEADGVLELVARMGTLPAPKLREVAPQVSEPLAAIVDRALELEREDRYQSAAEMRADVQRLLDPQAVALTATESNEPERDREAKPERERERGAEPGPRRSLAPVVLALLVAGGLTLAFVPQARQGAEALVAPSARPPASAAPTTAATGSASAAGGSGAGVTDASDEASSPLVPSSADADAAAASLADGLLDAGADASDASDEDEDDDDDPDASGGPAAARAADGASVTGRDASAPAHAAHAPAAKHPRAAPAPGKRFKNPRKKKRPRRFF